MYHKKIKHEDLVPMCTKFLNGKCDHPAQSCWYKHTSKASQNQHGNTQVKRAQGSESIFQIPQIATKSPEIQELKEIIQQAMAMMTAVTQKMNLLSN